VAEVKDFIFPLWNPYYLNGHPLFATLQPGVLYPFSLLYLFLPFNWAFNLNIEIHFALSGIFTYLLLRGMKASQGAAIISAIAFMLSGYLISVHSLLSTLLSVTWVPLFFLCYFSAIKNNRPGHAILSGVVGVVMFLGGGVEVCYLTFGMALFLTVFPQLVLEPNDLIKLGRRLAFFAIFCAVFFGLSAVQLIPFLELSHLSVRSEGLSYKEAAIWSLHPYDLVEFFLPDQYGLGTDAKKYWTYENWLKTIYMGGIPFILALLFFKKWDRRALGFLLLLFISLGLAMGNNMLFHPLLYDYLPFFNKLRYPVKFIFLAVLILSVAAGLGYDQFKKDCTENNPESRRWARYILTLAFFCMIGFGILNIFNESITTFFKAAGWDFPQFNETEKNLFNVKRFLAFSSLFCLGLFLYSKPKFQKPFVPGFMITLLVLDLFFAHFGFYHKANNEEIQKMGTSAKFFQSDSELFRIYVTPKTASHQMLVAKSGERYDLRKEIFGMGLLGNQRVFDIQGKAVTRQIRWKKLLDLVKSAPQVDSTDLLNMMNVKYVLSVDPITSPDFKMAHQFGVTGIDLIDGQKVTAGVLIRIYENKKMMPRAFWVPNCRVLIEDEDYRVAFKDKAFDPSAVVLLDKNPKTFNCARNKSPRAGKDSYVNLTSYQSNSVDLEVKSANRQFLFLSDSYYPGWKAYVDGEETEILRANYLFRAIVVEPGRHKVRFEYDPLSFKLGLAISVTTVLLCGIYYLVARNRRVSKKSAANHFS